MADKYISEIDMTEREKAYADFQKAWGEFKTAIFEYLHLERLEKCLDTLMQKILKQKSEKSVKAR